MEASSRSKAKKRDRIILSIILCFIIVYSIGLAHPIIIKNPFPWISKKEKAVIMMSFDDMRTIHPKMKRARCLICEKDNVNRMIREVIDNSKGEGDIATYESKLFLSDYDSIIGIVIDKSLVGLQTAEKGWIGICEESDIFRVFCSFKPCLSPVIFY